MPVHLTLSVDSIASLKHAFGSGDFCHFVFMSSRLTKKSFVNVSGRLGEDAVFSPAREFAFRVRRPPTRTVISGAVSVAIAPDPPATLQPTGGCPAAEIVAEPVGDRLHYGEGVHVGLLLRSIRTPRGERDIHFVPGLFRRFLEAAEPPRTIRSASETCLPYPTFVPVGLRSVELFLDRFQLIEEPSPVRRAGSLPTPSVA